jgi:hypothetical protein
MGWAVVGGPCQGTVDRARGRWIVVSGQWSRDAQHPVCPIFPAFTIHNSPFIIDHSQFAILNLARAGCAGGAPVVSGARNA